jgi:hypothetical protein
MKTKYIKTKEGEIVVFPEMLQHSEFRDFNPISAGFIAFGVKDGNPSVSCYGKSISLGLSSNEEVDSRLAERQILGNYY